MSHFAGWYVSPLNVAHWLDDSGIASCGRYTPEPHDRRPADRDVERCRFCSRLARPELEPTPSALKHTSKETRIRNESIRKAKAENPELSVPELGERFNVNARTAWLAIKRKPKSTRFADEVAP